MHPRAKASSYFLIVIRPHHARIIINLQSQTFSFMGDRVAATQGARS